MAQPRFAIRSRYWLALTRCPVLACFHRRWPSLILGTGLVSIRAIVTRDPFREHLELPLRNNGTIRRGLAVGIERMHRPKYWRERGVEFRAKADNCEYPEPQPDPVVPKRLERAGMTTDTKMSPAEGSRPAPSGTSNARPCMPLRMSV